MASGIRPDLVLADRRQGLAYLGVNRPPHCSGQLKLAPEHSEKALLELMGKPDSGKSLAFPRPLPPPHRRGGPSPSSSTYYFIAAHPGCTERDMEALHRFATQELGLQPEQVQIFTPPRSLPDPP